MEVCEAVECGVVECGAVELWIVEVLNVELWSVELLSAELWNVELWNVELWSVEFGAKNQRHQLATKRPLSVHTLDIVTLSVYPVILLQFACSCSSLQQLRPG